MRGADDIRIWMVTGALGSMTLAIVLIPLRTVVAASNLAFAFMAFTIDVAREVRHQLLHHLPHLESVMVHVEPYGQGGERHHRVDRHSHDGLPMHSHD
jgi:hypothetical protein